MTDEQIEKLAAEAERQINLILAKERFEKSFRERSFSGRNPELGKMMKCPFCGMRDRASVIEKHNHKLAECSPHHYRPVGNPFWRAKPGKMIWIPVLNKFMTLTR